MVGEDEIRRVAALMRIDVEHHAEHVPKVMAMLEFFEALDSADVDSEGIPHQETGLDGLRADEHVPFAGRLADSLKTHRGSYVRAPGLQR